MIDRVLIVIPPIIMHLQSTEWNIYFLGSMHPDMKEISINMNTTITYYYPFLKVSICNSANWS